MTLQDLITELEAATVPSFVLDAKIQSVLMPDLGATNPPQYSYSVDASLRLLKNVLPGWHWLIESGGDKDFGATVWKGHDEFKSDWEVSTPAIALVIAICRAKLAQEVQP